MKQQLKTPWFDKAFNTVSHQEYPRPQCVRESYLNLNGSWDYGFLSHKEERKIDGQINVPFSPESILSGVNKTLLPPQWLYYHRVVKLPKDFIKNCTYLHFGAVDQQAEVFVNGHLVGSHTGGFTPFSFEISKFITTNELVVEIVVKDETDTSYHSLGKQRLNPSGIFYTPQSGIWQTVWLESVPQNHIESMNITPLLDQGAFKFSFKKRGQGSIDVIASFNGQIVGRCQTEKEEIFLEVSQVLPWSPETPILYDFSITYGEDEMTSYGALRKVSSVRHQDGIMRFYLNNQPYLTIGVLDQGYWPDGLLTAPCDEAFVHDIKVMKSMGFNALRKHIKIEPLRFYYHCDRLGMLVWQDMINGGRPKSIIPNGVLAIVGIHITDHHYRWFGRHDLASRTGYYQELEEMVKHLYSVPSIVTWVPFNEAWGQFDARKAYHFVASLDKSRLIDHASGWSDQGVGDYYSRHIYFTSIKFNYRKATHRIGALTEFGGLALAIENHVFDPETSFGYKKMNDEKHLETSIETLWINQLIPQLKNGLSAIFYTQLSDVETEINGLITYDRCHNKIEATKLVYINKKLQDSFDKIIK